MQAKDENCVNVADDIYAKLTASGLDVLYDDRILTTGEKLNDADLIGIPYQDLVGKNGIKRGVVEIKNRKTGQVIEVDFDNVVNFNFLTYEQ